MSASRRDFGEADVALSTVPVSASPATLDMQTSSATAAFAPCTPPHVDPTRRGRYTPNLREMIRAFGPQPSPDLLHAGPNTPGAFLCDFKTPDFAQAGPTRYLYPGSTTLDVLASTHAADDVKDRDRVAEMQALFTACVPGIEGYDAPGKDGVISLLSSPDTRTEFPGHSPNDTGHHQNTASGPKFNGKETQNSDTKRNPKDSPADSEDTGICLSESPAASGSACESMTQARLSESLTPLISGYPPSSIQSPHVTNGQQKTSNTASLSEKQNVTQARGQRVTTRFKKDQTTVKKGLKRKRNSKGETSTSTTSSSQVMSDSANRTTQSAPDGTAATSSSTRRPSAAPIRAAPTLPAQIPNQLVPGMVPFPLPPGATAPMYAALMPGMVHGLPQGHPQQANRIQPNGLMGRQFAWIPAPNGQGLVPVQLFSPLGANPAAAAQAQLQLQAQAHAFAQAKAQVNARATCQTPAAETPGHDPDLDSGRKRRRRQGAEDRKPSVEEARQNRAGAIVRLRGKKRMRKYEKLVRYQCRKKIAMVRPRVNGRFATKEEVEEYKRSGKLNG